MNQFLRNLSNRFPYQFGENIGISVAHGWRSIFERLCGDVDRQLGANKFGFHWFQVKEKFGVLRASFEVSHEALNVSQALHTVIQAAVGISSSTCCVCGKHGRLHTGQGWHLTLCENHIEQRENGVPLNIYEGDVGESVHDFRVPSPSAKGPRGEGLPLLYLDFDGVLHPENVYLHRHRSKKQGPYLKDRPGHSLFEHANLLAELLEPYPNVRIILSTTWVRVYSYSRARQRLPEVLRQRVIGATWHNDMRNDGRAEAWIATSRGDQVCMDVFKRKPSAWLALDDDADDWPAHALPNLIRTDLYDGLAKPSVIAELSCKFEQVFGVPGRMT